MRRLSPRAERVVLAVALLAAFLLMASIFRPRDTAAQRRPQPDAAAGEKQIDSTDPHAGLIPIGELIGREYIVRIYPSERGPRFSVFDHAGRCLAALLSERQVEQFLDEPALRDKVADFIAGRTIMQVEPGNSGTFD